MKDENLISSESTEIDIKNKTIETAFNSGLGDLIDTISSKYNLNNLDEKLSMPIPIEQLPLSNRNVEVSSDVQDVLGALTKIINDPTTPIEVPFCLLGSSDKLTDYRGLYKDINNLEKTKVTADPDKFNSAVNEACKNKTYKTLVLGHTHPKLSEIESKEVLTTKLSTELKEKYNIKEVGLNLSLQDLYSLQWLHDSLGNEIDTMLGVLLYSGDLVLVELKNNKFQLIKTRSTN
jgi:hypothetical protein